MKKKVIKDQKYYEKKLVVSSKRNLIIGVCSSALLIGGLAGSTSYFALKGGLTDKDIFLRAFDRVTKGNLTMKGSIASILYSNNNITNTEQQYVNVEAKIDDKYEESIIETMNQSITNIYFLLGKDNQLHKVEKAEYSDKYYESDTTKGISYSNRIKQFAVLLNDYDSYKKNGNIYNAKFNSKSIINETTPSFILDTNITIENQLIKEVKIDTTIEEMQFSGTIMHFEFHDYNNTTINFPSEIKNFKPIDEQRSDISFAAIASSDDLTNIIYTGDTLIPGKEYFALLCNYNEEGEMTYLDYDSDTIFHLESTNIEDVTKADDKYFRFKVKEDAIENDDIIVHPYYCLYNFGELFYKVGSNYISSIDYESISSAINVSTINTSTFSSGDESIQLNVTYKSSEEKNVTASVYYMDNDSNKVYLQESTSLTFPVVSDEEVTFTISLTNAIPSTSETINHTIYIKLELNQ